MTSKEDPTPPSPVHLTPGNDVRGVVFGLIWAFGVEPGRRPASLDSLINQQVAGRKEDLTPEEDAARSAARDILRYGKYKPTGRGKPACEYLVRAARQDAFPRIFPVVDICNYISLRYLVSASIWDVDRAGRRYVARRGREGESYVFNASGQTIDLRDLLLLADGDDTPMVNPVKDGHRTKTLASSVNIGGIVYLPATRAGDGLAVMEEFHSLLTDSGDDVQAGFQIVGGTG